MGMFRLSQHAMIRAWERLGLGQAEARERVDAAPEVPALGIAMYNAVQKRYGGAVEPSVTLRFDDGVVWVIRDREVVTVYRERHPGMATLFHRLTTR